MRELAVRIRFTTPCLGNDKKIRTVRVAGKQKKRAFFLFSRTAAGKVIFMPQWWQSVLRKAAQILGRFHQEVKDIRFSLEVDGAPRPTPAEFYRRYYADERFSQHEAFFEGDQIGLTCLVPAAINDDDLWRLLEFAGKYYGISPARPGEYGRFSVVTIERRSLTDCETEPPVARPKEQEHETVAAKN